MAVCSFTNEPRTREDQILQLAATGLTDREMANHLGISAETIASYWRRILAKFGASSRTEVVAKALQRQADELAAKNAALAAEIEERRRVEELLRTSNLRLFALMDSLPSAVLFEDERRHVVFCNEGLVQLLSAPCLPKELVGSDCSETMAAAFDDPTAFRERVETLIREGKPVIGEELRLADGSRVERDYVPMTSGRCVIGHLWYYRRG